MDLKVFDQDITLEAFRHAIDARSFFGKKKLLLLDEVDTYPIKVVEQIAAYLFKLTRPSKGRGKKTPKPLSIPIVGTCNDLYTTSWRLRRLSQTFDIKKLSSQLLTRRVQEISAAENLVIPEAAIRGLVGFYPTDIRGALNALQLWGTCLSQGTLGLKDTRMALFSILNRVFRPKATKGATSRLSPNSRTQDSILDTCADFGDPSGLMNHLISNFLRNGINDPTRRRTAAVLNSFSLSSCLPESLKNLVALHLADVYENSFVFFHGLALDKVAREFKKVQGENRAANEALLATLPAVHLLLYRNESVLCNLSAMRHSLSDNEVSLRMRQRTVQLKERKVNKGGKLGILVHEGVTRGIRGPVSIDVF